MKIRSFFLSTIVACYLLLIPTLGIAGKLKVYRVPATKSVKLIIYSNPTVHSRTVTKLPINTRWIVRLSGIKKYSRSNTWFQVSSNGKKGWMQRSLLIFDAKATSMAIKDPKCLRNKTRRKTCGNSI